MGKTRVIAETGAGQHGVATATMAARFGFDCTIYMGEVDVERQRPNVFWMEQLGATVVPVTDGTRILKDAINEAFRDWVTNMDTTHYVLGTACGPHPFRRWSPGFSPSSAGSPPADAGSAKGKLPARVYACVGGGSNAMGIFSGFLDDARWNWWAWKPAAGGWIPANTPRGCVRTTPASAWPRGTRPIFCRMTTAR
jgi:tryptophan synthase beta chain